MTTVSHCYGTGSRQDQNGSFLRATSWREEYSVNVAMLVPRFQTRRSRGIERNGKKSLLRLLVGDLARPFVARGLETQTRDYTVLAGIHSSGKIGRVCSIRMPQAC